MLFPFRLGGGDPTGRESEIFMSIRDNFGDALSSDSSAANVAEDTAASRCLLIADRLVERWRYQRSPYEMGDEFLSRWQSITGVAVTDQQYGDRVRQTLLALFAAFGDNDNSIAAVAEQAFYPWRVVVHYTTRDGAVVYWPAGAVTDDTFWYSTIAHVCVEYVRPSNASDEDVKARRVACEDVLDLYCAAWTTFSLSETQSYGANGGEFGFFLDQPNLDVSCLES